MPQEVFKTSDWVHISDYNELQSRFDKLEEDNEQLKSAYADLLKASKATMTEQTYRYWQKRGLVK